MFELQTLYIDCQRHSRSTADNDAAHSVSEAIGEQTGNVVVHDLHLATLELSDLVQADLVLLRVLVGRKTRRNMHLEESTRRTHEHNG